MKIDLNRKEYLLLLDMLYMASWVLDAHTIGSRKETKDYHSLEQKIMGHAEEFDVGDEWVEQNEDAYYHTQKYEDERPALTYIDQFEEDTFWDELTDRLARRDVSEDLDQDLDEVDIDDWFPPYENLVQSYVEEFNRNGLGNLRIR